MPVCADIDCTKEDVVFLGITIDKQKKVHEKNYIRDVYFRMAKEMSTRPLKH